MASLDPKYVEVYRARDLPEAHSIRLALEESGIRVQIEGELLQGAVGELPPGWMTAPRILVKKSQLLAAQKVIDRGHTWRARKKVKSTQVKPTGQTKSRQSKKRRN